MSCKKFRCCYGDQLNSTSSFVLSKLMPTYLFILKGLAFWRKLLAMKRINSPVTGYVRTMTHKHFPNPLLQLHTAYQISLVLDSHAFLPWDIFLLAMLYIVNGCMYNIRAHTILLKLGNRPHWGRRTVCCVADGMSRDSELALSEHQQGWNSLP